MFNRTYTIVITLVLLSTFCYNCIKVIPERTVITYVNEKYASNASATVRRSSRRGEYVFNIKLINKTWVGNNVTFNFIVYEYNSKYNQYVRSMIQFHYKWCDLVLRDKMFGPILQKNGLKECPTPAGLIILSNMTFTGIFPFHISFTKGKLEVSWTMGGPTGEILGSLDLYVSLENNE